MRHRRTEPTRVLLAIVLTATAACQADTVSAPQPSAVEPALSATSDGAENALIVQVGDSVLLANPFPPAAAQMPGASLSWRASDSTRLQVDRNGLALGLAPGDVTVEARLCARDWVGFGWTRSHRQCRAHLVPVRVELSQVEPPSTPPVTPQGPPRRGVEGVRWLAGPIPPLATSSGSGWAIGRLSGGDLDKYERAFTKYADHHWNQHGPAWEEANYYDRAAIYYVWWARTGNSQYLDRANAIALNYRTNYLEAQATPYTYNASTYWHMPMGLALHYLVTGDEKSRQAVGYSAEWVGALHMVNELDKTKPMPLPSNARRESPIGASLPDVITVGTAENRWRARVLQAFVLSHAINAPQNGPATGYGKGGVVAPVPGTWAQKAKLALDKILAVQNPDGSYRDDTSGGAEKPFMDGLLNDAMILYYQFVSPDPRILSAVKRNLDYNWANTWLGESFAYYEWSYTSPVDANWAGGRYAAGDLNGLLVSAFGWVYAKTKDVTYRDRGDQVFRTIPDSYLQGSKHFNQSFTSSFRYLAYRTGQE